MGADKPSTGSHKCYHYISLRVGMNLWARLTSNCIYSAYPTSSQLAFKCLSLLVYPPHYSTIVPRFIRWTPTRELRFRLLCRPNPDPTTCLPRHVDRWAFSSFLELMKSPCQPSPGPPNLWSYLFSNQSWEHYFWRLLSTTGFKIWLMFNLFQCANVLVKTAKPTWFSLPGLCWVAQGSKIWILSPVTQALQWHYMRILLGHPWRSSG